MPSCAIKWCGKCTTTSSYTKDGITFHRFPNDDVVRKEIWINATHRDDFFPTKYSVICSRHFTPDCFENLRNNRRRLYSSSVPTLFLPSLIPPHDSKNTLDQPCSPEDISSESSENTIPSVDSKNTEDKFPLSKEFGNESSKSSSSGRQVYKGVDEQYNNIDLTPRKRKLKRQVDHLIHSLNKKKKDVKRLQDKTRALKKKVANLQEILNTLIKNSLLKKEIEEILKGIGVENQELIKYNITVHVSTS